MSLRGYVGVRVDCLKGVRTLFLCPSSIGAGKRRIRVHTLCLPVVNQLSDVYAGADVQAVTCLLANMGEWERESWMLRHRMSV